MTAKDSETLLKALVGMKKEIDVQSHQLNNLLKSHLAKHPFVDEDLRKRADFFANHTNRAIGTLPNRGGSMYGVRRLVAKRFKRIHENVVDLQSKPRTVDRWCRVCGLISEMILISDKENDQAFFFADAFHSALDLLKEGAMHNPDGKGASAFALNRAEQDKIIVAIKEIAKTWWASCSRLGLNEYCNENVLGYESFRSGRLSKLKKVKLNDRPYSIFFQGDRKSATLSMPTVVDVTNFIKMLIPSPKEDDPWIDLLRDADLAFSVDALYYQFLLARPGIGVKVDSISREIMEAQPRIKNAINSSIEKIEADESSAETRAFKVFKAASDERFALFQESLLKQIARLGFNDFGEVVENKDFGPILATCLNVDPDIFAEKKKGKGGSKNGRGRSAFFSSDLRKKMLRGEHATDGVGIVQEGQIVRWWIDGVEKSCSFSAQPVVELIGRVFSNHMKGAEIAEKHPVYVTSGLWRYAKEKAQGKKANKKSAAAVEEFFAKILIRGEKVSLRKVKVHESQIAKKKKEPIPSFVYRIYLNQSLTKNGVRCS